MQRLMMAIAAALLPIAAAPAAAQDARMMPIATPAQPDAIPLDTGTLPDAPVAESWHRQYGSVFARNVRQATLTPFLPDPAKATGAAVVVAPGGGFRTLSMENEGWAVARALAARGVAAFVLKYRLHQTPAAMPAFERSMAEMFSATARPPRLTPEQQIAGLMPQIADARAAFALIRRRAGGVAGRSGPYRHGRLLGRGDADAGDHAGGRGRQARVHRRHLWAAGAGRGTGRRAAAVRRAGRRRSVLRQGRPWPDRQLAAARRPVEFHLFEQGGHGFGMYPKPTTSTGWFDAFVRWLDMHGWTKRAG